MISPGSFFPWGKGKSCADQTKDQYKVHLKLLPANLFFRFNDFTLLESSSKTPPFIDNYEYSNQPLPLSNHHFNLFPSPHNGFPNPHHSPYTLHSPRIIRCTLRPRQSYRIRELILTVSFLPLPPFFPAPSAQRTFPPFPSLSHFPTCHCSPVQEPANPIRLCRLMHQHTKRQMDLATRSSRRAPADQGVSSMTQLSSEGSVDSVDSLQQ